MRPEKGYMYVCVVYMNHIMPISHRVYIFIYLIPYAPETDSHSL